MAKTKPTYLELENKIKQLEFEIKNKTSNSILGSKDKIEIVELNEEYFRTMVEQSPIGTQIYNLEI